MRPESSPRPNIGGSLRFRQRRTALFVRNRLRFQETAHQSKGESLSSTAQERLFASFACRDASEQEVLVHELLTELGLPVTRLSSGQPVPASDYAIFTFPHEVFRDWGVRGRSVNLIKLARSPTDLRPMRLYPEQFPSWARTARGLIVVRWLTLQERNNPQMRQRLKDALRETCRMCTRRTRQAAARSQPRRVRNLIKRPEAEPV